MTASSKRSRAHALHGSVLAAALAGGTAFAQDASLEDGRDLFLYFCAECHGSDAASVGPMAEMLALEPPGLTGLAQRNGGRFPIGPVAFQIDGRTPVEGHVDMPIFGSSLDGDQQVSLTLPDGPPLIVTRRLADLLVYLNAIQVVGN